MSDKINGHMDFWTHNKILYLYPEYQEVFVYIKRLLCMSV